jgi:hypothetical protein
MVAEGQIFWILMVVEISSEGLCLARGFYCLARGFYCLARGFYSFANQYLQVFILEILECSA